MSSTQFNISEAVKRSAERGIQRSMEKAASDLILDVTSNLAEKFDFDVDDALKLLGVESKTSSKKKPSLKPKKYKKKPKESVLILPWCGVVMSNCCQAIKSCNKLYVQCRNDKLEGGNFCRRCQTETDKNDGRPPYGVIQERLNDDYRGKDGKKPINYANFMKSRPEITRERALEEAEKLGWTIPDEQFTAVVMKKGRKPKAKKNSNVETSDTDEDLFEKNKKKAGTEEVSSDESSDDDEIPISMLNTKKRKHNGGAAEEPEKRVRIIEEDNEELQEESMSESDCESDTEDIDVSDFGHDGKEYLIGADNSIYDKVSEKRLGTFDDEKQKINFIKT